MLMERSIHGFDGQDASRTGGAGQLRQCDGMVTGIFVRRAAALPNGVAFG